MLALILIMFLVVPFLSVPFLLLGLFLDKNLKHKKIYAIFLVIVIALLLYYLIPDESKDLNRYYTIMGRISGLSPGEFLEYLSARNDPAAWSYFYIFSKLGNYNLVMIFTTFISYGIIFYILFDYQKRVKLSNIDFGMVILFILSTFYLIDDITGVRFCLGRLIFFLALYLEMYKGIKKRYVILLYLLSILMHSGCIIFVILRVVLKIFKDKFSTPLFVTLLLVSLMPNLVVMIADSLSNIPFLSSIGVKATTYMSLTSGFYLMFVLQLIIGVFLFFMSLFVKKHTPANAKYANFVLIVLMIGLLTMGATSFSTRLIRSGIAFAIPVMMDYLKVIGRKDKIWIYFVAICICVASIMFQVSHLVVDVSYGSLFERGIFENLILLLFKV